MELQDKYMVGGEITGCELVLDPLVVLNFDDFIEKNSLVQKADLSTQRRFDLACGEVKYFKPDGVNSKPKPQNVENIVWSKSISPRCCNCVRPSEGNGEECGWLEESDLRQSQNTTRSMYSFTKIGDQLSMMNIEDERSNSFVAQNHVGEDSQDVPTLNVTENEVGSSPSEMGEGSIIDDDSSYLSTSLYSSYPCTPNGESRDSPTLSFIEGNIPKKCFSNNVEYAGEENSKQALVDVNSKQNFMYLFNNESCSKSGTPKSQDMFSNQLSSLVDDVEERRKSLISAAISAIDLSKFKCGDLDLQHLESMQVALNNDMNTDSNTTTHLKEFQEDARLDVQDINPPNVEKEVHELDAPDGKSEERDVFSLVQQIDFSRFDAPQSHLQEEIVLPKVVQSSSEEICTINEAENLLAMSSKVIVNFVVAEASCETQINSDLALLTMGEVEVHFSLVVANLHTAQEKHLEATCKPVISLKKNNLELTTKSIMFSFMKQIKEHKNLDLGDFYSDGAVSNAKATMVNKHNLKDKPQNIELPNSNEMNLVPTTVEASCKEVRLENTGEQKDGEGKEWFQQRLWCYLFENMNRAVDEFYFLCELESDVEQINEALVVLDKASVDFKDLKTRVDSLNQVKKNLGLPQPTSPSSTMSSTSTKAKLHQRRPHAIAWEVCDMECSQEQTNILSSSLEEFKKVQCSSQFDSLQDKQQAHSFSVSENFPFQSPAFAQVTSPSKQKEQFQRKGSSISDSELLTNMSIESDNKISPPNTSSINRFISSTTTSEQCASFREKQVNVPTGSKSTLEAWKEKRNWEDILSSPLSGLSQTSRSTCPCRKSIAQAHMLHEKRMSPKRKKRSLLETKKEVNSKQAHATRIRMELENEKLQCLQKTREKLNRINEWHAVKNNKFRGRMHARQQRGEFKHEVHLAQIARLVSDESSKVNEIHLITSLNEENKKSILQQKLQDLESQTERLQSLKVKQKEDIAKEEATQERRRQLEAERLQKIAEVQQTKEEAKTRREEGKKAASAARKAQVVEHVRKKEAWTRTQQETTKLLGQKLYNRLKESFLRQTLYLEQIKERVMMGHQIVDTEFHWDETLGRSTRSCIKQKCAGLINLVGDHNNSLQSIKKKVKRIRHKLTSKKIEYYEPPIGIEGRGLGTATVTGGARSKIGRWMQELGRLQAMKKPGSLIINGLIFCEMIKYMEEKEPELHAARQQGLIDYIVTSLTTRQSSASTSLPAWHSSNSKPTFEMPLLRLLMVLLSLPANRSFFIARNLLPPLVPMLSTALEHFASSDYSGNTPEGCANTLGACANTVGGCVPFACAMLVKVDKTSHEEKVEVMQEALEGLLWIVSSILGHTCFDDHLIQMQEDLAELLVACEVVHKLHLLFALFDRPQMDGAPIPGPVVLGLRLLETLTGPRGKMLTAAHGMPVKIVARRPPQAMAKPESVQEDQVTQKRIGVREECTDGDSVVVNVSGIIDEAKACDNGKSPELARRIATELQVDGSKNQVTMSRSTKFLLKAVEDVGLVGVLSLLSAVLLQANPRASPEQAATALPSNFEEVATSVLRVLNNVARLDPPLVQNMLALPDLQLEFFYLVSFLLSHCTCKWKSTTDQVAALLMETLLLLGYAALLHPSNQAVLRWGKSPTILHKMCDLPFAFFSDPKLTPILIGTVLSVCYGSERNRDVVQQELSMDMLLAFLKNSKPDPAPAPAPPATATPMRAEDVDASVKSKPKSVVSDSESFNTATRGRSRHKTLSDAFFPSPRKPNRLLTKNSNLSSSMSMVSTDGDSATTNLRGRSVSGRVTPVTESQIAGKRTKGAASVFPSPSPSINSTNLPQSQTTPSVATVAAPEANAFLSTPPAVLLLQNRFPQSLWPHAVEFFSTSAWIGSVLKPGL